MFRGNLADWIPLRRLAEHNESVAVKDSDDAALADVSCTKHIAQLVGNHRGDDCTAEFSVRPENSAAERKQVRMDAGDSAEWWVRHELVGGISRESPKNVVIATRLSDDDWLPERHRDWLRDMAAREDGFSPNQNTLNKGQIESQIQDSLGGLRRQIAGDKSSLINQLYATENPEMAANEALSRVRTVSQQTPPLSPMGDLFKTATIGLGGALSNANNPYNRVTNPGVGRTSGRTVFG